MKHCAICVFIMTAMCRAMSLGNDLRHLIKSGEISVDRRATWIQWTYVKTCSLF